MRSAKTVQRDPAMANGGNKMDPVNKMLENFLINSDTSGIELSDLGPLRTAAVRELLTYRLHWWWPIGRPRLALLAALLVLTVLGKRLPTTRLLFADEDCIVTMPGQLQKAFRPPESCKFCDTKGTTVPRLANVSPEEFEAKYAYRGGPVIVTDATANWTAIQRFDYWFFKQVYETYGHDVARIKRRRRRPSRCQFFPYQTGLRNIREAFEMAPERVRYEAGTEPWYFGWSNCDPEIVKALRQHYGRPYFLPEESENSAVDWVFMGGPGFGAHMHVDNVRLPSWQSQLKGTKMWTLAPPPECYYQCNTLTVTVSTGETIVLDTNKWYHKTEVLPGPISITVGSEYD